MNPVCSPAQRPTHTRTRTGARTLRDQHKQQRSQPDTVYNYIRLNYADLLLSKGKRYDDG